MMEWTGASTMPFPPMKEIGENSSDPDSERAKSKRGDLGGVVVRERLYLPYDKRFVIRTNGFGK